MKVWLKRVVFTLVVVFIVALVSVAIFLLTFDPNAYKSKLEELVYNRYHRTLAIKGDIELSLFPRIGLSVQGVSLSDRDSTDTFAAIDSARFAVAIWPLMFNRLVVDHVAVTGFRAWLVRDKDGRFNFRDLLETPPPALGLMAPPLAAAVLDPAVAATTEIALAATEKPEASPLAEVLPGHDASGTDFQIDIAGLDLKNGEIHLYDQATGAVVRLMQLDLNTGRMTFNQAFDVAMKGKLKGDSPKVDANIEGQALVRLEPDQKVYSAQKLNVQVGGKLGNLESSAVALRGNLAYSAYSQMFSASGLEFLVQGNTIGATPIKALSTSLTVPQLKVDRSQSELRVEKLAFRATGQMPRQNFDIAFDAPGLSVSPEAAKGDPIHGTIKLSGPRVLGVALAMSGLGGDAQNLTLKELKLDGSLKDGDRLLQLKMTSPANWNVFQEKGGLSAIKGDVRIEDAALPGGNFEFPLIGSVRADLIKDELASEINAVISGSQLEFGLKAVQLADPKVTFDLTADTLDLNTMFPPVPPPAPAGNKAAGKAAAPPAKAAAPAATAAAKKPPAPEAVDLSFLQPVDLTGRIKIGELKVGELEAEHVSAAIRAVEGRLDIDKIVARLYGGTLGGRITAKADNSVAAQLAFDNVEMEPLLQGLAHESRLAGRGSVKIDLKTQGTTGPALKAGLTGVVHGKVRDGAIKGINVAQTLREVNDVVRNVFSGQLPDVASQFDMARQTDFTSLDTEISFNHGQGTVKKFALAAPLLRITAGTPASLDIVNNQMDMVVNVNVVNTKTGQEGKDLADLKDVAVPVRISGPFQDLGYKVQWKDISSQVVKQAVQEGLLDLLSNKADKKAASQGKDPESAAQKPGDAVKSIGEALKGLLGK
jgi:AsmA protein